MYSTIHSPKEISTFECKNSYNMLTFRDENYNDITIFYNDRELILKAGSRKTSVKLSTLFQAMSDAYNAGEFYLEEVDAIVNGLEFDIEEIRGV